MKYIQHNYITHHLTDLITTSLSMLDTLYKYPHLLVNMHNYSFSSWKLVSQLFKRLYVSCCCHTKSGMIGGGGSI